MINSILKYSIFIIFVFFQVYFVDNFSFKIELIFIPIFLALQKNDSKSLKIYSFLLFVFSDFFRNEFVSISLIIYLVLEFTLSQFSRIWSREVLIYLNFFSGFFIYCHFSIGILSQNFVLNLLLILIYSTFTKVVKDGYFRFN